MNALLDTHTFLWWNADDPQLSETARQFISDSRNQIFLSAATSWEISIKFAKGRLLLPEAPDKYIANRLSHYGFRALPIAISHTTRVASLPAIHTDPFDRLLITQAISHSLTFISRDRQVKPYAVKQLWEEENLT